MIHRSMLPLILVSLAACADFDGITSSTGGLPDEGKIDLEGRDSRLAGGGHQRGAAGRGGGLPGGQAENETRQGHG